MEKINFYYFTPGRPPIQNTLKYPKIPQNEQTPQQNTPKQTPLYRALLGESRDTKLKEPNVSRDTT